MQMNKQLNQTIKIYFMKSTSQLLDQQKRIDSLLWLNTTNRIKEVHPETGGNLHLTHNWGNDKAKSFLDRHQERQSKLFNLFNKYFEVAFCNEYPNHLKSKSLRS